MLTFYENNELKVALFGKLVVSKRYMRFVFFLCSFFFLNAKVQHPQKYVSEDYDKKTWMFYCETVCGGS